MRRRRVVDRVIRENFWEGFLAGLNDAGSSALEYASTSGLYRYNGVRRIAEKAGYDFAQQVLEDAVARRQSGGPRIAFPLKYEVPASVVAECYAEARKATVSFLPSVAR